MLTLFLSGRERERELVTAETMYIVSEFKVRLLANVR